MDNPRRQPLSMRRRLIQLYAALLYNAHLKGFLTGTIYTGPAKVLCVPGFNCYSCPSAIGACPLGALQNALSASGRRAPAYVVGILLLYGLLLGRTICGWLCPAGLLQELLHKIPTPKLSKSPLTRTLSRVKYALLLIFVVALPLWYGIKDLAVPAFCKYICPIGTLEGAGGLLAHPANHGLFTQLGGLFAVKAAVLLAILALCLFVYRGFCRFLCPLGAIYGLFSKISLLGVRVEPTACIDCGKCVHACPVDIRHVGDSECVHCGGCIPVCPTNAISLRMGKFVLWDQNTKPSSGKRRLLPWIAALLVLVCVFWTVNRPAEQSEPTPAVVTGTAVGETAADFTVPLLDGSGSFTLSEHRGETVVLNFWATWCGPCVAELPYFNTLWQEGVAVTAIHGQLITDDIAEFLSDYNYDMPFALDESGAAAAALGVTTMLPHTVIVDENGIIVYNAPGSLTEAELRELLPTN